MAVNITYDEFNDLSAEGLIDVSETYLIDDTLTVSGTTNIIVGRSNSGTITDCTAITIGSGNTGIGLTGCTAVFLGDGNESVTVSGADYLTIGEGNRDITVTGSYIIIGDNNTGITVSGQNIHVAGRNARVDISGEVIDCADSTDVSDSGMFDSIKFSGSLSLSGTNGNELDGADTVVLENVNNNVLNASDITLSGTLPFMRYSGGDATKEADSMITSARLLSDNDGLVLDTSRNALAEAGRGVMDYRLSDGVWYTSKDDNKAVVRVVTGKGCEVTGAGEYTIGESCTITATPSTGFTFNNFTDLLTGEPIASNPYTFTVAGNTVLRADVS